MQRLLQLGGDLRRHQTYLRVRSQQHLNLAQGHLPTADDQHPLLLDAQEYRQQVHEEWAQPFRMVFTPFMYGSNASGTVTLPSAF